MPMAGVGGDLSLAGGEDDEDGGEETPDGGADEEVDAHDEADDGASEDGVGESVAHVGHASEDDVDADEATQGTDKGCGYESLDEEVVGERFEHFTYTWGVGVGRGAGRVLEATRFLGSASLRSE